MVQTDYTKIKLRMFLYTKQKPCAYTVQPNVVVKLYFVVIVQDILCSSRNYLSKKDLVVSLVTYLKKILKRE